MKVFDRVLMEKVPLESKYGDILIEIDSGHVVNISETEPGVLTIRAIEGTLVIQPGASNTVKLSVAG